jgi:hypothetical protein
MEAFHHVSSQAGSMRKQRGRHPALDADNDDDDDDDDDDEC